MIHDRTTAANNKGPKAMAVSELLLLSPDGLDSAISSYCKEKFAPMLFLGHSSPGFEAFQSVTSATPGTSHSLPALLSSAQALILIYGTTKWSQSCFLFFFWKPLIEEWVWTGTRPWRWWWWESVGDFLQGWLWLPAPACSVINHGLPQCAFLFPLQDPE